jgi:hypothetical protein
MPYAFSPLPADHPSEQQSAYGIGFIFQFTKLAVKSKEVSPSTDSSSKPGRIGSSFTDGTLLSAIAILGRRRSLNGHW